MSSSSSHIVALLKSGTEGEKRTIHPPQSPKAFATLVLLTFPVLCCALWNGERWCYRHIIKGAQRLGDTLLPTLMAGALGHTTEHLKEKSSPSSDIKIKTIVTVSGPGPLTALRSALAFSCGMVEGMRALSPYEVLLHTPSWFQVRRALLTAPCYKNASTQFKKCSFFSNPWAISLGAEKWAIEKENMAISAPNPSEVFLFTEDSAYEYLFYILESFLEFK